MSLWSAHASSLQARRLSPVSKQVHPGDSRAHRPDTATTTLTGHPGPCWLGTSSDDSAATPVNTGIDAAAVDCSVEKSLGWSIWPITRVILRKECRRRATVVHPVCMPRGRELCPCHVSRAEVSESMIRTQGPAATAARACQEHCEPGFMSQAGGSAIWTPYASASVGCRSAQGPVRALIVRDPYHRLLYRELITGHGASGIPRERP